MIYEGKKLDLVREIIRVVEFFLKVTGKEMEDFQVQILAGDLYEKFKHDTLEDVILMFKMARQGDFGKVYKLDNFEVLKDKDADSSFNKRVVLNENGEFALKDSTDIKVIIPENTTVNINHQYPNAVPSNIPEGVERIREFIKNLKTAQFNKLTEDDFSINIDETLKNNFRKKGNGIQYLEKSPLPNNSPYVKSPQIMGGVSAVSIRAFPTNKKWCLKVPVENTIAIWKDYQGKNQIGLVRNHHDDTGLSFLTGAMIQLDNGKNCSLMTLLRDTKQFVKTPDGIANHSIYAVFYCDGQGLIYASYINATGTYLTEIIGVSDVDEVRLAGALSYTYASYPQFLEFGKSTEYYLEP